MTVNEIYNSIAQNIVNCIPADDQWSIAEMNINAYPDRYAEYTGKYLTQDRTGKGLKIRNINHREMKNAIYSLIKIMTEDTNKNKWNRAKFIVHSDNRFEMEFSWDQTLDDEIKNYS